MKILFFKTLLLFVNEIEPSVAFYHSLLQCAPIELLENFASFKIGNIFFNLHLADIKNPASTGGSVGYFWVDNLTECIDRAVSLGAIVWRGPLELPDHSLIVQIQDPFGNVIGFEGRDPEQQNSTVRHNPIV